MLFYYLLRKNIWIYAQAVTIASCHLWASKSTNLSFAVFLILLNTSQSLSFGTCLTIRIVTQTKKHLGIAYILFFTEPMKVLALVLGSKLTNHWGIVLAFFVYIHFVPNLKFGENIYIFINVRKTALSDCLQTRLSEKVNLCCDSNEVLNIRVVSSIYSTKASYSPNTYHNLLILGRLNVECLTIVLSITY